MAGKKPRNRGKSAPRGRPSKLTADMEKRLIQAIEKGCCRQDACEFAGISFAAMKEWMARGRAGEEPYAAFLARVKAADGKASKGAMDILRRAMRKDWRAVAWWFEHARSKRYVKLTRTASEITGKNGGPLRVDYSKLSDAELETVEAILAKATVEGDS